MKYRYTVEFETKEQIYRILAKMNSLIAGFGELGKYEIKEIKEDIQKNLVRDR